MGHIAPVNSVDFASSNSDFLVTSGRDRAVKIWHWKSKTVKLNIDLRKQGRGTGKH
jgi:WD40 repeat protein